MDQKINSKRKKKAKVFNAQFFKLFSIRKKVFGHYKQTLSQIKPALKINQNAELSYSRMPNISSIIENCCNKMRDTRNEKPDSTCNCTNKDNCPLKKGKCRKVIVLFEAKVEAEIQPSFKRIKI